jgi:hypothetical protein
MYNEKMKNVRHYYQSVDLSYFGRLELELSLYKYPKTYAKDNSYFQNSEYLQ